MDKVCLMMFTGDLDAAISSVVGMFYFALFGEL